MCAISFSPTPFERMDDATRTPSTMARIPPCCVRHGTKVICAVVTTILRHSPTTSSLLGSAAIVSNAFR